VFLRPGTINIVKKYVRRQQYSKMGFKFKIQTPYSYLKRIERKTLLEEGLVQIFDPDNNERDREREKKNLINFLN
jgi:hypothetical protein